MARAARDASHEPKCPPLPQVSEAKAGAVEETVKRHPTTRRCLSWWSPRRVMPSSLALAEKRTLAYLLNELAQRAAPSGFAGATGPIAHAASPFFPAAGLQRRVVPPAPAFHHATRLRVRPTARAARVGDARRQHGNALRRANRQLVAPIRGAAHPPVWYEALGERLPRPQFLLITFSSCLVVAPLNRDCARSWSRRR